MKTKTKQQLTVISKAIKFGFEIDEEKTFLDIFLESEKIVERNSDTIKYISKEGDQKIGFSVNKKDFFFENERFTVIKSEKKMILIHFSSGKIITVQSSEQKNQKSFLDFIEELFNKLNSGNGTYCKEAWREMLRMEKINF